MVGLGGLEPPTSPLSVLRSLVRAPRNTGSLESTGAALISTSADDLASVSSDWIAGRRTQLESAWKTHLLPEDVSTHC